MKESWQFDILDHKWNNLRRWVEACEKNFTPDGLMSIHKMKEMMNVLDKHEKALDEAVINALCSPPSEPLQGGDKS